MRSSESFFEKVYEVVALIPFGRVTSYGAVAAFLGSKGSSRMVGWAMNQSHSTHKAIPAHRVVNRKGLLTGKAHFGGHEVMKQLLENEGFIIENDQIMNFKERFWDPSEEISDDLG